MHAHDWPRPDADNWRGRAACRHFDPSIFFPTTQPEVERAKTVCRSCPVAGECLAAAMAKEGTEGVWGGVLFGTKTIAIRDFAHGTRNGFKTHRYRGEEPCEACRVASAAYFRELRASKKENER